MEEIQNYKNNFNTFRMSQMLIRFLTSISIFAVTVFFTPNFNLSSFPPLSSLSSSFISFLLSHLFSFFLSSTFSLFLSSIIFPPCYYIEGFYLKASRGLKASSICSIDLSFSGLPTMDTTSKRSQSSILFFFT